MDSMRSVARDVCGELHRNLVRLRLAVEAEQHQDGEASNSESVQMMKASRGFHKIRKVYIYVDFTNISKRIE